MRAFFIHSAERLVAVLVVFMLVGSVINGAFAMQQYDNIYISALAILLSVLITILTAGLVYLGFGIYRNTKQTNELLAQLIRKY